MRSFINIFHGLSFMCSFHLSIFLQYWHKGCFHCEVCKMTLNMNNYKGYEKKPYCNAYVIASKY